MLEEAAAEGNSKPIPPATHSRINEATPCSIEPNASVILVESFSGIMHPSSWFNVLCMDILRKQIDLINEPLVYGSFLMLAYSIVFSLNEFDGFLAGHMLNIDCNQMVLGASANFFMFGFFSLIS